ESTIRPARDRTSLRGGRSGLDALVLGGGALLCVGVLLRGEGFALHGLGAHAVDADGDVASQRDAVEHAVDVEVVDVLRCQVRGRPVVPELD
ncbi:MAG: hypothetical protein RLZZ450_7029, partial [Pseudomonadota bacterium]